MKKFYLGIQAMGVAFLLLLGFSANAQWQCTIDIEESGNIDADNDVVTITKWTSVSGLSIANNKFGGLMRYLPAGYNNAGNTSKYPVIIYFGGRGAQGDGSQAQLCELFSDQETSLPWQVEKGDIVPTTTRNGVTYNYIIIAPTYRRYQYPTDYPKADEVSAFIDYVVANYRVDEKRIYLTGMSAGANMVINYVSNSAARANRVAAYNTASLCSSLYLDPNNETSYQNIIAADLPGRFFHCTNDNTCKDTITKTWVTKLNDAKPGIALYHAPTNCNYSGHNSWNLNYDQNYLAAGPNLYDWFIQYSTETVLPVKIKSFNARLTNGTVALDWITSSEISSKSFRVERAGSDYVFQALSTVPAAGNSNGDKAYKFVDPKPLPNLNLYRLVQVDADGKESISEIVKVMNKNSGKFHLNVSPNPFTTKLTAYLNLEKRQRVVATITDLNGRMVATQTYTLNEGASEINLPTTNLQKGMYLLKVETEQQTQIEKIIRN